MESGSLLDSLVDHAFPDLEPCLLSDTVVVITLDPSCPKRQNYGGIFAVLLLYDHELRVEGMSGTTVRSSGSAPI